MRRGVTTAVLGAILVAACSGAPRATNAAVEACQRAAREQGLGGADQLTVAPTGEGRYRVVLDVVDDNGDRQAVCDYDPKAGARIQQAAK
ncbi:MAG TPA: hypothetical protein VFA50_21075 [Stellaceae bacterium]|nr:hypothetical protein [Stellaceae bacterium]